MYSERATVLVVDDDPCVSNLLYEDLSEVGYKCTETATGEDALKRISMHNFNLLLLDLLLILG